MGGALAADDHGVGGALRRRTRTHALADACDHAALSHTLHLFITVTGINDIQLYMYLYTMHNYSSHIKNKVHDSIAAKLFSQIFCT